MLAYHCFIKAFVNAVKKNVDEVEESVTTAERELGSHTIQKVLSSIPGLRQVKWVGRAYFRHSTCNIIGIDLVKKALQDCTWLCIFQIYYLWHSSS